MPIHWESLWQRPGHTEPMLELYDITWTSNPQSVLAILWESLWQRLGHTEPMRELYDITRA